eukprot:7223716-Pyramimonas_sp.AAC.1
MRVQADLEFHPFLGRALAEARRSCECVLGPGRKVEGIALASSAPGGRFVAVRGGPRRPPSGAAGRRAVARARDRA